MYNFTRNPADRGPQHGEDLARRMKRGKEKDSGSPNIWLTRQNREGDWTRDEEHYPDTTPLETLLETRQHKGN